MDYTRLDDPTLLRLVAQHNEHALQALYERYSRLVYGMASRVLGESTAAEEVTQDVFLSVWQKAYTYHVEQARASTWIASITRHRAIDLLRSQRARPVMDGRTWEDHDQGDLADPLSVEELAGLSQQRQRILKALAALPDEQSQALSLAFFQGYTHGEIAEVLGEPLGTVKTRIRLAMQKLRSLLEEAD